MKHLPIDPNSWEQMASDGADGGTAVRAGAAPQEEMLRAAWEEKCDRRK